MKKKKNSSRAVTRTRETKKDKNKFYQCSFAGCDFRTVGHTTMRRHRILHNPSVKKRKPFACSFPGCFHRATHRWNLIEHEQTHDPNHFKRFSCPTCSRYFTRKRDVARHQANCKVNDSTDAGSTTNNEEVIESGNDEEDEKSQSEIGELLSLPEKIQIEEENLLSAEKIQIEELKLQLPEKIQIGNENLVPSEKIRDKRGLLPPQKIQLDQEKLVSPPPEFQLDDEQDLSKIQTDDNQKFLPPPKIIKLEEQKPVVPPQKIETGQDLLLPQKIKRFKCPKCGHRTSKLCNANRHLKKHLKSPFKCQVPDCTSIGGFDTLEDLMKHMSDLHVMTKVGKELLPIISKADGNSQYGANTLNWSTEVTKEFESTSENDGSTRVLRSSRRKF